jgi:hypothetical protein
MKKARPFRAWAGLPFEDFRRVYPPEPLAAARLATAPLGWLSLTGVL